MPHQLLLTATPIPRSLAMTHFSHMDISIIDELPPGRTPVTTAVIKNDQKLAVFERLRLAISQGKQAYWVCPLIEESDKLQCTAAVMAAQELTQSLAGARIGLLHGRTPRLEKEQMMRSFKEGALDILVATTVIEVGVDVPNASLMIIENAERLGLAQLHQLRGRVGRGREQSFCILMYQSPLSEIGRERLQIMRNTNNGFTIAEKDLQLRGAGDFLGVRQSGFHPFKIANLQRDAHLLPLIAQESARLLKDKRDLSLQIVKNWQKELVQYYQS